jgi:alpha-N-arabinofuranosidase
MATYTRIKDEAEASIFTSPKHVVADINPLMYGGFTEYVRVFSQSSIIILPPF